MSEEIYKGITFKYSDFLDDIDRIRKLAGEFLLPESVNELRTLRSSVESARKAANGAVFSVPVSRCIKTINSTEYRGGEQSRAVFGTLSFRWVVSHTDKGRQSQLEFNLIDEATTGIHIKEPPDTVVAHWQFEVGDASSPGCHFHASTNQRGDDGLFPQWLKLPRPPGLLLSPFDGLEFLLGELFPVRWPQHVSRSSDERNNWATGQLNRLVKILEWQQKMAKGRKFGTPWMSLKKAKPVSTIVS